MLGAEQELRIKRLYKVRAMTGAVLVFCVCDQAVNAIRGMHGFSVGGRCLRVNLKKGEEQYLTPGTLPMSRLLRALAVPP